MLSSVSTRHSAVYKEHIETLHGVVRSHHRTSGTMSSTARHFASAAFVDIAASSSAKLSVVRLSFVNLPGAFFTLCEPAGSPLILLTVEGPTVPLSRGLFGFVALWCCAEECAFSLSTQAQRWLKHANLPIKFSEWSNLAQGRSKWRALKSSRVLTPQSCKEQGARIKKEGDMPRIIFRSHPIPPDVAPVGQCAGSTRLYSAMSQTWSCACVLREKAHSSA